MASCFMYLREMHITPNQCLQQDHCSHVVLVFQTMRESQLKSHPSCLSYHRQRLLPKSKSQEATMPTLKGNSQPKRAKLPPRRNADGVQKRRSPRLAEAKATRKSDISKKLLSHIEPTTPKRPIPSNTTQSSSTKPTTVPTSTLVAQPRRPSTHSNVSLDTSEYEIDDFVVDSSCSEVSSYGSEVTIPSSRTPSLVSIAHNSPHPPSTPARKSSTDSSHSGLFVLDDGDALLTLETAPSSGQRCAPALHDYVGEDGFDGYDSAGGDVDACDVVEDIQDAVAWFARRCNRGGEAVRFRLTKGIWGMGMSLRL
ncbi:hypothetical protein GQ44DRAFT_759111 [Phaeosphaeriaceae sp. PMI808]|nr:hypothetical protein GQ44DRAFT_759111 [Phaeosphaeriaceae sp. PMI808]